MTCSCLSDTSNPYSVIQHVFCNKNLYSSVITSIQKSRDAREILGTYCLYFCNPCNSSSITLKGDRILDIYENPCKICWRCSTERVAGLTIQNADFFADVLSSLNFALMAKSESKLYCKTFNIPRCLFPNISNCSITLTGEEIIKLSCRGMTPGYCRTMK